MLKRVKLHLLYCIYYVGYLVIFTSANAENDTTIIASNKDARNAGNGAFSPRMDYEQWKPLGRGDPLKNDPTFDYVPPALDHVHYWLDTKERTNKSPQFSTFFNEHNNNNNNNSKKKKTEILLLGISSKKSSIDSSPLQSSSAPSSSRKSFYETNSNSNNNFLKFVDGPKFQSPTTGNGVMHHHRNVRPAHQFHHHHHHHHHYPIPVQYLPSPFYSTSQRKKFAMPYTMLMPPPVATKSTDSQPAASKDFDFASTTGGTPTAVNTKITVQPSNLIYHSSSVETTPFDSNKVSRPPLINWTPSPLKLTTNTVLFPNHLQPPETYIQVPFATVNFTHNLLVAANSDQNVNYVTAPPLLAATSERMHKGVVSDDDLEDAYVQIGKSEAKPSLLLTINDINHHQKTIESMQTMQPPPPPPPPPPATFSESSHSPNLILLALSKEKLLPTTTSTAVIEMEPTTAPIILTNSITDTAMPITTTMATLTTDPLFKHYKQPLDPIRGPLYLIIQGHSKVKTYKPSRTIHGIAVDDNQKSNEIGDSSVTTEDDVDEDFFKVEHLHHNHISTNDALLLRDGRSRRFHTQNQGSVKTLKHAVESGIGRISFVSNGDFKETELRTGFQVGPPVVNSTKSVAESYHKGIVEEVRDEFNIPAYRRPQKT